MKDHPSTTDTIEAAIDSIKADVPSVTEIASASERARAAIDAQRGPQGVVTEGTEAPSASKSWNSIEDYIAAIPTYLAKELTPAQTLLFEEETRQSIPLHRALNEARGQEPDQSEFLAASGKSSRYRWLAAAATVAALAIALFVVMPQLPSFDQSQLAQVEGIDGQLYQLVDGRLEALTPGTWINGRQRVRSAGGSSAIITLDDGSQIEVDERSELSITRRGIGNRVDVSRGRILVVASPQGSGTLDVITNEFAVSVTGTIFEVAHGTKGSRVAVIEGSVDVLLQGDTTSLEPGEVMDSRMERAALTAAEEIAWSQNADQYIAMLQEVVALQQDLQMVMDVPTRYSTRLLDLVPEDTAMYIAVPNAPEKIVDVYDVISARMESSETLSEYWAEFEANSEAGYLDLVMSWLREIGYALGDETVFAITMPDDISNEGDRVGAPVILSEVDVDAFRASFDTQVQRLRDALEAEGLDSDEIEIAIIDDPADALEGELSIMLREDILVASISAAALQDMQANLENGSSAFVDTELHGLLQYSYDQGTEILGAVDFSQLFTPLELDAQEAEQLERIGISNLEYLIAQHQQQDGITTMSADVFFDGERQGVMSLLANPGPMGSLGFFSTDTTLVAAALLREPSSILEEFGPLQLPDDFEAQAELELFYNVMGILGGEVAFGLDGPALPTPAWKVVIEAYDETVLQESITWSVARFNEYAATVEGFEAAIELTPANVGEATGYELTLSVELSADSELEFDLSPASFNYAYVDGYLIAAPDRGLIDRVIGFYTSGSGLQTDSEFQELLAHDGFLNFSAITFSRLGELVGDVIGSLPSNLTGEQQAAIDALDVDVGPSISSALALPDRIHLAHNGSSQLPIQLMSQLIALAPMLEDVAEQIEAEE